MNKFGPLLILAAILMAIYALGNLSGESAGATSGTPSNGPSWLTSMETAQEQSRETGKPILVDFTGSDWCGWCVKLKAEVFDTSEFEEWAAKNVVLLELDYPRRKKLPTELKAQNEKLAKQYNIKGFPTILLLDADGKVLGRMGYMRGGPGTWTIAADKVLIAAGQR